MANERLTIGELARRTGTTVKTLRFYSDEGLLPPAERSQGGYRLYAEDALLRVDLVRTLRDAGLGLDAIKKVLHRETSLADALRLRLAAIEAHVVSLQRIGAALRAALRSEPNEADVRRICAVTRLSNEERKAVIERFYENVTQGIAADDAWKRQVITSSIPKLPEATTPEQLDAWIEFAELLSEPTFVENLRKGTQVRLVKSEMEAVQRAGEAIALDVKDAIARGLAPESDAGRAVVERYAEALATARGGTLTDAVRREVFDLYSADPRMGRYWELLAAMHDTPEMTAQLVEGKWIARAVHVHFAPS